MFDFMWFIAIPAGAIFLTVYYLAYRFRVAAVIFLRALAIVAMVVGVAIMVLAAGSHNGWLFCAALGGSCLFVVFVIALIEQIETRQI